MASTIYVQLLNEGTDCWRPVEATQISENVYELGGRDTYDPEDEEWEFLPGSRVVVEEKLLSNGLANGKVLVAVRFSSPKMDTHDVFPRAYHAMILEECPGGTDVDRLYFPGAECVGDRDGLPVEVVTNDDNRWIGLFAFGDQPLTGLYTTPDPNRICIIARGKGYIVNVYNPTDWFLIPMAPINRIFQPFQSKLLIFSSFTDVCACDGQRILWSTDHLASGDVVVGFIGAFVAGTAVKFGSKRIMFQIDTQSGKIIKEAAMP